MARPSGVLASAVVIFLATACGDERVDVVAGGATTSTVAEPPSSETTEEGISGAELHVDRLGMVVHVELRPEYTESTIPRPQPDGEELLAVQQWTDGGRTIGVAVLVDPGEAAPLFDLEATDSFHTPLGRWTLHEVGGEDHFERYMAMVRTEGLVIQVIGGSPGDSEPVTQMAMGLRIER